MPATPAPLGFIGLGVMGEPMSANLLQRSGHPLTVFDIDAAKADRVVGLGATRGADVADVARKNDIVFLSLPAAEHVEAVVLGPEGLLANGRPGQIVVDMSTSPVELARRLSEVLAEASITFVDAPVARTRQAAIDGTLAVMVGCDDDSVCSQVSPLLSCMATDVAFCGRAGAGALMKLLNNMVVFETVVALAEAISVVRRSGLVDETTAFDVLSKGSAQSFALENHGKKALLPDLHPTEAFSSRYMAKDLSYALAYARSVGLDLPAASLDASLLGKAIDAGHGDRYHTSVVRIIDPERG